MRKMMKILVVIGMIIATNQAFAQNKNVEEVKIRVSVQCEMCKDRIEKALAYETGVIKSEVDVEKKSVVVKYKISKTNPDKIRLAISKIGYDADQVAADPKAYDKLPACCKKPSDENHQKMQ